MDLTTYLAIFLPIFAVALDRRRKAKKDSK